MALRQINADCLIVRHQPRGMNIRRCQSSVLVSFVLAGFAGTACAEPDLCSGRRYQWEMDKNSEPLTAALATCEKEQAFSQAEERAKSEEGRVKREARARLPGVKIGMTKRQVLEGTNWGAPDSVNETVTERITREQWVYGAGNYLYFSNGKVSVIQRSK